VSLKLMCAGKLLVKSSSNDPVFAALPMHANVLNVEDQYHHAKITYFEMGSQRR